MSLINLRREALEKLQEEMEWNDKDLAEHMGINRVQVWRVKEGRNEPGRDFISGILKACPHKTFEDIFFIGDVAGAKNK